jgi:hypothetical protein
MITTVQVVMSLRPGAEWSMTNDDVENITWHTEGVTPLTQAEVDAEIERLEQEELDKAEKTRVAKESAIQKLLSIGLTMEEVEAFQNG